MKHVVSEAISPRTRIEDTGRGVFREDGRRRFDRIAANSVFRDDAPFAAKAIFKTIRSLGGVSLS